MIEYYNPKGEFVKEEKLTRNNIDNVHGMKIRCSLKNGEIIIGFCNSNQILTGDYLEISCKFHYKYGFSDIKKVHWTELDKIVF